MIDRLNDVHFLDTDNEFAKHINDQAVEAGLIECDDDVDRDMYSLNPDIVMQQFSPLFMSQWFMIDHAKNPCMSITCDNDFLFVFRHFEEYLIVAINGDGTETEDFLTRKTLVFIRLVGFLMGPVTEEIGKPRFSTKQEQWTFIRHLMSTWTFLANHEQSYLVEAVEKLHSNQVVSELCVDILQTAVTKIQEAGERNIQHALMLVNSKLLAHFSNRSAVELQSSDMLCIILLARTLFPTQDRLEDLFAQSYRPSGDVTSRYHRDSVASLHRNRYETAVEGFTTGEETENDEYFSAYEKTPHDGSPSLKFDTDKSTESIEGPAEYPEVSERFVTPTTSPIISDQKQSRRASSESPTSDQKKKNQSAKSPKRISPKSNQSKQSDKKSDKQSKKQTVSQELKEANSKRFATSQKFMRSLEEKGQRRRHRSHTVGEIEDQLGILGLSKETEVPAGRGRSSSLHEEKPAESQACSIRHNVSDSHLVTSLHEGASNKPQDEPTYDYLNHGVFLLTTLCKFTPYQLHCYRIYPGIVLVVLTEMPRISQAPRLVQLLQLIKDLLNGTRDKLVPQQRQIIYETINTQIMKTVVSLRKAKEPISKLCSEIKSKWDDENVREGILQYLEQNARVEMSSSLERSLKYLYHKLREIFVILYLPPSPLTTRVSTVLSSIAESFRRQLGDYKDYLVVKAQRNITMTTYIEEFPGLIHFIYVNRRTNQIMAPSLNIAHNRDDHVSLDATQLLKDKIWQMMSWAQMKLHQGYTTVMAREGDYVYSYFLWFENVSGDPEVIQKPYRPDSTAPPPGILTGNFYKYITHKCFPNNVGNAVYCNELFMMHVGLANSQYVASHCRQLAAKLYETSADILGNISLFGT